MATKKYNLYIIIKKSSHFFFIIFFYKKYKQKYTKLPETPPPPKKNLNKKIDKTKTFTKTKQKKIANELKNNL